MSGRRTSHPVRLSLALCSLLVAGVAGSLAPQARADAARHGDGTVILTPPSQHDHRFRAMRTRRSDLVPASRRALQHVGVASMNVNQDLPTKQARQDALRLTGRHDVDLVGWQEANHDRSVYQALTRRGWTTRFFDTGASELATSWRTSEFTYVSSAEYKMHPGSDRGSTRFPFPARWVTRVTLADRASGHRITLINTHLNQKIEDLRRPGHFLHDLNATRSKNQLRQMRSMWKGSPGRYVLGTGDYNFDARSDQLHRPAGGITREFQGRATTSYRVLGLAGVAPTDPDTGRDIDYVLASRHTYDRGYERFESQHVLRGYHSDHRPLLVRFSLY